MAKLWGTEKLTNPEKTWPKAEQKGPFSGQILLHVTPRMPHQYGRCSAYHDSADHILWQDQDLYCAQKLA